MPALIIFWLNSMSIHYLNPSSRTIRSQIGLFDTICRMMSSYYEFVHHGTIHCPLCHDALIGIVAVSNAMVIYFCHVCYSRKYGSNPPLWFT